MLSVYDRPDAEIKHQVTQDLILGTFLCDPYLFTVTVKDGIVTIEGTPETTAVGHDIIDAVRHMEGVVAVRDRLRMNGSAGHQIIGHFGSGEIPISPRTRRLTCSTSARSARESRDVSSPCRTTISPPISTVSTLCPVDP